MGTKATGHTNATGQKKVPAQRKAIGLKKAIGQRNRRRVRDGPAVLAGLAESDATGRAPENLDLFQKTELAGWMLTGQLRQAGLRVTKPRLAVLAVVCEASDTHEHLSAAEVATRARMRLDSLSTQAVYDCLEALTGAGLLRRIQPAGSAARYETRVADNHHHLVCRRCGSVTDVDCAVGSAPCLEPSDASGFAVDEAEVMFWGMCPRCSAPAGRDLDSPPLPKENQEQ